MTATGNNHTNALEMEANKTSTKANKMPADKKATKTNTKAVEAPAPAPVAAPAAATTTKKAATKKVTPSKAEVVVPTVAAPTATPVATTVQSSETLLASVTDQIKALATEFNAKVREVVKTSQEAAKQAKKEHRDSKKKRKINPADMTPEQRAAYEARRNNNAFLKPKEMSDELCSFMGLAAGSKRSQTEVTHFISEYVKSHNCFDPSFKRRIIPNALLAKLLRVDDKTEVTYLNLQRYLKVHFKKA